MAFLNSVATCLTGRKNWKNLVAGAALLSTQAFAAPLLELAPNRSALVGQQSDMDTTPWIESVSLSGPAAVTSLTWWGYYDAGANVSTIVDDFVVNNISLSNLGLITRSQDFMDDGNGTVLALYKYVLDLSDPANTLYLPGGTSFVALSNDWLDGVWYWQGSGADELGARAYAVNGTDLIQTVPEPTSLALAGLALAGLAARRKTRPRIQH